MVARKRSVYQIEAFAKSMLVYERAADWLQRPVQNPFLCGRGSIIRATSRRCAHGSADIQRLDVPRSLAELPDDRHGARRRRKDDE